LLKYWRLRWRNGLVDTCKTANNVTTCLHIHGMHLLSLTSHLKSWHYKASLWMLASLMCGASLAQVCASPGKDGPVTISTPGTVANGYFQGNGNLAISSSSLTLGTQSGDATAVTVGDKLLIVQMQGAAINTSDNNCYGDGAGPCTDTDTRAIGSDRAQGHLVNANFTAGRYEYVRVTSVAGSVVTFAPALINNYVQANPDLALGQRRYQVLRVPQYASLTISGSVRPLRWDGLVGGVSAMDVAGAVNFSGAGPHINASGTGFRTGYGERGPVVNGDRQFVANADALTALRDTTKGEGIAGSPRHMWIATDPLLAPLALTGASLSNPALNANTQGYPGGDYGRGAPGNAGGGGVNHNSAGGGGGNGGRGGAGGATYSGDGSRDVGGYGGALLSQSGFIDVNRLAMGGGGGAGDVNGGGTEPTNPYEGPGGVGGGLVFLNAGSAGSGGYLSTNGTTGPVAYFDAAGGGGAGGSIRLIMGTGTNLVRMQADGAQGGTHDATGLGSHCSGSGGGGGGGVLIANAGIGAGSSANAGLQGPNPPDNPVNCQGDAGEVGAAVPTGSAVQPGVQPGYQCLPALTVSKRTTTPSRTAPPDTTAQYQIVISNTGLGTAYGVGANDTFTAPFGLPAVLSTAAATLANATGPSVITNSSGVTPTAVFGTAGGTPANSYTLDGGSSVTLTFTVNLNTNASGVYQNSAAVRYTDPLRTTGASASAGGNPSVTPGGTYANGSPVPGSNYNAASSTQEDVTIAGASPTVADIAVVKTGTSNAFVGDVVNYVITVINNGPANAGTVTLVDTVSPLLGSVSWVCVVSGGIGDCDVPAGGTGASGTGNSINLSSIALNSGGAIQITVSGTAASAGNITNTASATLNTPGLTDPNPSNNTGTATTSIAPLVADIVVLKTNGVNTVSVGSVSAYSISVGNNGPAQANGTVVADPAGPGLTLLSVTCTSLNGAVCPAGLTVASFQSGIAIPNLPVGGTVTFNAVAQVTAAAGSNVLNTATVTPPLGTTDPAPGNNTSTDTDTVVVPVVAVVSAAAACPAGSVEQLVNLVSNGDLANTAASLGGNIPQFPVDFASPDTSMAIQQGPKTYAAGAVVQSPFIGDLARSVASSNNWLYSNGNNLAGTPAYRIFSQALTGLVVGRTYEFMYYGSNALNRGQTGTDLPNISMRTVSGGTTVALATHTYANEPTGGTDTWTLRQSTFVATTSTMSVELWDAAAGTNGDEFASTQFTVRECRPTADPRVSKTDGVTNVTTLNSTSYQVVVSNPGPGDAPGVVVKDPFVTGLQKDSITCTASAGAQCPLVVTIAGIEGAGLVIPQLSANSTVTFTIPTTVQALAGNVTNTANLTVPSNVIDSDLSNNSATDVNLVTGIVNLQITKTDGVGSVAAGGSTTYTITLTNFGPSFADNAVFRDPVATGLSCTSNVACTSSNGNFAVCPGATVGLPNNPSIPIANVQTGVTLPRLRPGGSLVIALTCNVTATGQ
jgi:uncharacterized repeat protein (TIGR01451 family)